MFKMNKNDDGGEDTADGTRGEDTAGGTRGEDTAGGEDTAEESVARQEIRELLQRKLKGGILKESIRELIQTELNSALGILERTLLKEKEFHSNKTQENGHQGEEDEENGEVSGEQVSLTYP